MMNETEPNAGDEYGDANFYDGSDTKSIHQRILTSRLDIRDKKSGLIDLLTSGIDTLAKSLSILLYHLSANPETQLGICDEVSDLSPSATYNDLMDAHYTKACIQESYRINPTAFVIARLLEEDTELSGYALKSGTFVLCHTMTANQQEENFTAASQFIPERWLPDSQFCRQTPKPQLSPALVCPFGAGRRMCPGKRYTKMELSLVVSKVSDERHVDRE